MKTHFLNHRLVLIQDASLKNAKAFFDVAAEAQIHAGFIELDGVAPAQNASDSYVQRYPEIKHQVRTKRETVQVADPAPADAAHYIASERGIGIAICANDCARLYQRHDVARQPVCKIGGVNQAER